MHFQCHRCMSLFGKATNSRDWGLQITSVKFPDTAMGTKPFLGMCAEYRRVYTRHLVNRKATRITALLPCDYIRGNTRPAMKPASHSTPGRRRPASTM